MEQEYRKDLSHTTWEKVYERQQKRAAEAAEWLDGLELRPGDRVLDLGAGPGFVSIMAARRVGIRGVVYAVDRSAEALGFLAQQQEAQSVQQIRRIVADVAELELADPQIKGALVTMMLHHDDNPAALLRNVARLLPRGCRVVVAEFHPEGPCEYGAPRDHRIHPDRAEVWCREAGLQPITYKRQTPEHYMYILERA